MPILIFLLIIMFCAVSEQEAILSVEHFTGKCFGLSLVWWSLKQESSKFIKFIFVMKILPFGLFPVRLGHLHRRSFSRSILQLMVQAGLGCWSGGKVQLGALYCIALELPLVGSCL